MASVERRHLERENLFQLADARIGRDPNVYPIKVRNLSPRGLMGECAMRIANGTRLTLDLRDVGPVSGTVVWVQEPRFGLAFDEEIVSLD